MYYAQLLPRFPPQGCFYRFVVVDVPAYGCVPFARLYVFAHGTLLEIQFSRLIEDVEMNDGVKELVAAVAFLATGFAYGFSRFVDYGEVFDVLHHLKFNRNCTGRALTCSSA